MRIYTYTINRASSSGAVNIPWSVSHGTTDSNDFYGPTAGIVSFANGESTKTFSIEIVDDADGAETFTVSITAPSGYHVSGSGSITSTIPTLADYIVTNDSEWNTVMALSDATLAGKVVEVARGITLSAKTLAKQPSTPLTIRAAPGGGAKPRIDTLTLDSARNLVFEDIDFIASTWATDQSCVLWKNTPGWITMRRCERIGNYRGTVGVIDPTGTNRYPEYACIVPQLDENGVVTSFIVTRPYVGDLLADGEHTMEFNSGSGLNWDNEGTITGASKPTGGRFAVSGGNIVTTGPSAPSVTNGGVAKNSKNELLKGSIFNGSLGALSARIKWTGQRRMGEWLAYGDRAKDLTFSGPISLEDCGWRCLSNGYKAGAGAGQLMSITGGRFDLCYQDCVSIGLGGGNVSPIVVTNWNFMTRPFALQGDAGDPHGDGLQFFTSKASCNFRPNVTCIGNAMVLGNTRGAFSNLIFLADPPEADLGYEAEILGNLAMGGGGASGIMLEKSTNSFVFGNSVGRDVPTGGTDILCQGKVGPSGAYGVNYFGRNIVEGIGNGSAPGVVIAENNVAMGKRGVLIDYDAVFNDPTNTDRDTLAKVLALYQTETAYAGQGHTVAGYVDYVNRTIDRSKEPTVIAFPTQPNQVAGSVVASGWQKIIGGPSAVAVSITNGEYQIADTDTGTNATAWSSSAGATTRGKYIQVRGTANSTTGGTSSVTLTLNGRSTTFVIVTASTPYGQVQFSGDDMWTRSTGVLSVTDNARGGIFLPRFNADLASGFISYLFAPTSGNGGVMLQMLTTGKMRVIIRGPGAAGTIAQVDTASVITGGVHDVYIGWDVSDPSHTTGFDLIVDNAVNKATPTIWLGGEGVTVGYSIDAARSYQFGGRSGARTTMKTGGLWVHTSERPMWANGAVRALAASINMGADGSGPTGTAPTVWINGNAAKWNSAAGLNDGTGAKYAGGAGSTGGAGTVTDV